MIDMRLHSAPMVSRRAVLRGIGAGVLGGVAAGCAGAAGDRLILPVDSAATAMPDAEPSDALRERLEKLDLDALSPRDALEILYELQREVKRTED